MEAQDLIRVNSRHYFILKLLNKQELHQQIAFNHLSDIEFQDFRILCKKCTAAPNPFLVIVTTLASDGPLRFRKKILKMILKTNHENWWWD